MMKILFPSLNFKCFMEFLYWTEFTMLTVLKSAVHWHEARSHHCATLTASIWTFHLPRQRCCALHRIPIKQKYPPRTPSVALVPLILLSWSLHIRFYSSALSTFIILCQKFLDWSYVYHLFLEWYCIIIFSSSKNKSWFLFGILLLWLKRLSFLQHCAFLFRDYYFVSYFVLCLLVVL